MHQIKFTAEEKKVFDTIFRDSSSTTGPETGYMYHTGDSISRSRKTCSKTTPSLNLDSSSSRLTRDPEDVLGMATIRESLDSSSSRLTRDPEEVGMAIFRESQDSSSSRLTLDPEEVGMATIRESRTSSVPDYWSQVPLQSVPTGPAPILSYQSARRSQNQSTTATFSPTPDLHENIGMPVPILPPASLSKQEQIPASPEQLSEPPFITITSSPPENHDNYSIPVQVTRKTWEIFDKEYRDSDLFPTPSPSDDAPAIPISSLEKKFYQKIHSLFN